MQLGQLFSCSMCASGHLCECDNMRTITSIPALIPPILPPQQASSSTQLLPATIFSNNNNTIPSASSTQPAMQQLFSLPSSSPLSYSRNAIANLGATRVTRKCVRCKCPNCISGQKGDGNKPKQHICHIPSCGKVYGKTSHLKAHLLFHAGQRPFVCNWQNCNRSFTRSDELQRHLRTHTGEKRFVCEECGKRFTRSDHLSKHMQTHRKNKAQVVDPPLQMPTDSSKE